MSHGSSQPVASLSRRALLTASGWLASTAALLGLGGVQSGTATASIQGLELEGTWAVAVRQATPNDLITFISDGSLVGATTRHLTESPLHGVWVRTGDREFAYTHWRYRFDPSGAYIGTQKVHGRLTLNETLNEYTAQAVSEVYDRDGNLVSEDSSITPRGERIMVERLP